MQLYGSLIRDDLDDWRIPCGASELSAEDRVRAARILQRHASDMREAPLVLRIEFDQIYISPEGGKAYEYIGQTIFFKPIAKMRAIESCGSVIAPGADFDPGICG